jgi:hypothetical protein
MNQRPICRFLRTKNAYGDVVTPYGDWVDAADSSDAYWCLSTMGARGPDGGQCDLERCGEERRCFADRLQRDPLV